MQAGQVISGRYRLEEQLGSGGGGVVWRATDMQLGRDVALKRTLPGDAERQAELIKRLRAEARLLAMLNHPNVVTLHDVVDDGTECWLVMEYVPARSLAEQGRLAPAVVAKMGVQLASALKAVHATGIVHRDIKPANVFVTGNDIVKLGDFGISRVITADETITVTGTALLSGTPGYVAPEVARGEAPTSASDIFSLGSTLFAAIEGVSPVGEKADNALVLIRRAADGEIATSRHGGDLAPVLAALLQVDPAKRPSAAQVGDLLVRGGTAVPKFRPRRSRRIAIAAGALVVVLAVGAWFVFSGGSRPDQAGPLPTPSLGTVATADPCSLVNTADLDKFGDTNLVVDDGGFNECDDIVKSDGGEVDVRLMLENEAAPYSVPDNAQVENTPTLTIRRIPENDGHCDRQVLLVADGHRVVVSALLHDNPQSHDLCAMADAATASAVAVLNKGEIPRRGSPPNPKSLIKLDACALASDQTLALFPGVDVQHPKVGFGNWTCEWDSDDNSWLLRLSFAQSKTLASGDDPLIRIAGRVASVEPEDKDGGTCEIDVANRTFGNAYGYPTDELLVVEVSGAKAAGRFCDLAKQVAQSAAAVLPGP